MNEATMAWLLLAAPNVSKELLEECLFEPLYAATDKDGEIWVYAIAPNVPDNSDVWELETYAQGGLYVDKHFRITVYTAATIDCDNWRDSLIRIPKL